MLPKECNNNTEVCEAIRSIVIPSVNTANNRLNGYLFDNAGNTIRDAESRRITYDGENKQVKVETLDLNGNPVSTIGEYTYDGDGRRIKKRIPSTGEVSPVSRARVWGGGDHGFRKAFTRGYKYAARTAGWNVAEAFVPRRHSQAGRLRPGR